MAAAMCCLPAYAAEAVTTVNSEQELIDALKTGENIALGADIALTQGKLILNSGVTAQLDLNGKSITNNGGQNVLNNFGTLTIKGNGTLKSTAYNGLYNEGKITIEGGSFIGENNGFYNSGNATINGGNFFGNVYNGVYNNGSVTIYGGTFSSSGDDCGYSLLNENKFDKYGKIIDRGVVNINGGTFNGQSVVDEGENLNITDGIFNVGVVNINSISGGTFNGSVSCKTSNGITGGYFNVKLSYGAWKSFLSKIDNSKLSDMKFTSQAVSSFNTAADANGKPYVPVESGYSFGDVQSDETYRLTYHGTAKFQIKAGDGGTVTADGYFGGKEPSSFASKTVTKGYKLSDPIIINVKAVPNDKYVFKGWYTTADASDECISTNPLLSEYTVGDSDNITLYAIFENDNGYAEWIADYDSKTEFTIENKDQMKFFKYAVSDYGKTFEGKTVTLKTDLVYTSDEVYTPIGNETTAFCGTFDGDNHTISGITKTGNVKYNGIFGNVRGVVKNLNISDCVFDGGSRSGAIAGTIVGKISNCSVSNTTVYSIWFVGGIAGHTDSLTIENSKVDNVKVSAPKAGGVIGYACDITVNNVTAKNITSNKENCGAIAGHINAGTNIFSDVTVNSPDFAVILSNYSESKGTIKFTGKNDITAVSIIYENSDIDVKKILIEDGNYNITSVVGKTTEAQANENIVISGGSFSDNFTDFVMTDI